MKFRTPLLLLISLLLCGSHCKKHKPVDPIDQLPPETQTGAGTFGCLVDGQLFLPKGDPLGGPILSCAYQYINGGYYLQLYSKKDESTNTPIVASISIGTDSMSIEKNKTYKLITPNKGVASGKYSYYTISSNVSYFTSDTLQGELFIKRFDLVNQIASGTFWFNAINPNGDTVRVTDGRFDVRYTQ